MLQFLRSLFSPPAQRLAAIREQRLSAVRSLSEVEIINQERCSIAWESLQGGDRVRPCTWCRLNVYNFADMTPDQICETINQHEGRLCARFYALPDGTMTIDSCAERQLSIPTMGIVAVRPIEINPDQP